MSNNALPQIPGDTEENTVLVIEELNADRSIMLFATAPYLSVSVGDIVSFGSNQFGIVQNTMLDSGGSVLRLIMGAAQVFRVDGIYHKANKKGCGQNAV